MTKYIVQNIHGEKTIKSKEIRYKHLFDVKASINPEGQIIK